MKYCISKVTNETEDKEGKVICLSETKESEKQVKKPAERPKREKETEDVMEVLYHFHDLHEMVNYEEYYQRSSVEEFHANCSMSKTKKKLIGHP